ncbi:MAG: TetR/AcrR family transcriptional regulator [Alphaproteobacteria bacterium]|nr:TetR/AcrR family transcriptional regulator [Alphaproteobacteria bacterium]
MNANRGSQRQETFDKIQAAALDLFITTGYEGTTVDEIAAAAGLTKGAIYFHFQNKAELLLALLDEVERSFVDPMDQRVRRAGPSAQDKLAAFAHQQSELDAGRTKLAVLGIRSSTEFAGDDVRFGQKIRHIYRRLYDIVEDVIELGKAQGVIRTDISTRQLASFVIAAHDGTFLEWQRRGLDLDPAEIIHAFRTLITEALSARPDAEMKIAK